MAGTSTPLPQRLARQLLSAHEMSSGDDASAGLRVSQEALGQMLGVSRQSVNRQLKQWESEGLLSLSYGRIRLLDVDAVLRASIGQPTA